MNHIYINQNLDLIDDIYLTPVDYPFCEKEYQRIQVANNTLILNFSQTYQPHTSTSLCVHRKLESRQIMGKTNQQKSCQYNQKICQYKNMSFCVQRKEKCPISDFIISSQKQKDNYELVGSYESENVYLLVKRQSMDFNPLIQASVFNFKQESIQNIRYYKLNLLYLNQFKYEEDEFNDQTPLSPNLLYQFDQFIKGDEIKDQFSNKWVFKESVIYFKQTHECSQKRSSLFNLNVRYLHKYSWLIITIIASKLALLALEAYLLSHPDKLPIKPFAFSLLVDVIYVYLIYYVKLEFYFALNSFIDTDCVDKNSEIKKMIQIFNPKYELIGIFMSTISLAIMLIFAFFIYKSCKQLKSLYQTIFKKLQRKQIIIQQQNKDAQVQVEVLS
ncbi:hypothetical protein ABPG72_004908 [Tetrahymena utriculariae]